MVVGVGEAVAATDEVKVAVSELFGGLVVEDGDWAGMTQKVFVKSSPFVIVVSHTPG